MGNTPLTRQQAQKQPAPRPQPRQAVGVGTAASDVQVLSVLHDLCSSVAAAALQVNEDFSIAKAVHALPQDVSSLQHYAMLVRSISDWLNESSRFWSFTTPQIGVLRRSLGTPWLPSPMILPAPVQLGRVSSDLSLVDTIGRLAKDLERDKQMRWQPWVVYTKALGQRSAYLQSVNIPYRKSAAAARSPQAQLSLQAEATSNRLANTVDLMMRALKSYDLQRTFPAPH